MVTPILQVMKKEKLSCIKINKISHLVKGYANCRLQKIL